MSTAKYNLCDLQGDAEPSVVCPRPKGTKIPTYQQQVLTQARTLGQLRRQYIERKCSEQGIDEQKALCEIGEYKANHPCASEGKILKKLIRNKASPDTIIYQTYVVEAEKGNRPGADETYHSLRKFSMESEASRKIDIIRPCCDEGDPAGAHRRWKPPCNLASCRQPPPNSKLPVPQRRDTSGDQRRSTSKNPPSALQAPSRLPRPQLSTTCRLPPRAQDTTCARRPCPGPKLTTPQYQLPPSQNPCAPCRRVAPQSKLDTRIPVPVRQVLPKNQRQQTRDYTGSRIPCPVSKQRAARKRLSKAGDESIASQDSPCRRLDETIASQASPCRRLDETIASQASPCRRPDETMASQASPCRRPDGSTFPQTPCSARMDETIASSQASPCRRPDETMASQASPCRKKDETIASQPSPCKRPDETMASQASPCRRPDGSTFPQTPSSARMDESSATSTSMRRRTLDNSRIPTSCRRTVESQFQTSSCRRRISFGSTQVSYFEDELPSLLGETVASNALEISTVDPACLSLDPATSFQQYKSMIEQEKKEIRDMHVVVTQLLDRPKVEFRDMYTLVPSISYLDEGASDTVPEVAAAMLHSDELGLNMKSPPEEVYNTLFRGGDKDKTVIRVAMEDNAEIVVPVSGEGFEATIQGYEQRGLFENVNESMPQYTMPEMPRPKKKKGQKEGVEGGKGETSAEITPTKEEGKAAPTEEKPIGRSESDDLEGSSPYNVHLKAEAGTTHDFLQIRGSQPPSWWPGYYVAMGDSSKINVVTKPWDVLEKAWRKLAPTNLKPDNGTYVVGI